MKRSVGAWRPLLASVVFAIVASAPPSFARSLTIDERVEYQRSIEQVYWNHRIWPAENKTPKPPLSAVMPDTALRAKVEGYLKKSNALKAYWQHPVTAADLQAELNRMARETRDGAILRELFHALGDDPYVIAETLARQTLVDRLIHDWYSADSRFHGDVKARAEAALAACKGVECMKSMGGHFVEGRIKLGIHDTSSEVDQTHKRTLMLNADEWHEQLRALARRFNATAESLPTNRLSGLEETPDAFVVSAILARNDAGIETANVVWPKRTFDYWWETTATGIALAIEPSTGPFEAPPVPPTICTNDTWEPTRIDEPDPRRQHTAVWTGTEMIVWGGTYDSYTGLNTGGRYNPSTNSWVVTSMDVNVPSARLDHTAVWTGTTMIVWGGSGGASPPYDYLDTGGCYNPATDTWKPTSTGTNAPGARAGHSALWTGEEMIVWGGFQESASSFGASVNTGARYNPSTDTWNPTSTGSNVPAAREEHTAIWTGTEMIVWGGSGYSGTSTTYLNTGGRYNPSTDSWTAISTGTNVPPGREGHTAIWTGTEMIVWGGWIYDYPTSSYVVLNTGGRYNALTDTWAATSTGANVPGQRSGHTAVWSGAEMIVWGGFRLNGSNSILLNTGGRYNPSTDTWRTTSTGTNAPGARSYQTAVWTGTEMIVWGGTANYPYSTYNTGGRYNPSMDTWTPTASGAFVPAPLSGNTAVWTGTEMIVWGGQSGTSAFDVNTGGRYNPSTDSWTAISTGTGVPAARSEHSAVWTGTQMIIWGGKPSVGSSDFNSGGRYSPSTDTWTPTATNSDVPEAREGHTAVWTGAQMIVWGGYIYDYSSASYVYFNTGGRYEPTTDRWTRTSTGPNVPDARAGHSTVWTGTRMIVWGGSSHNSFFNTGGLYDPSTDTWRTMSTQVNAPEKRAYQTAVWTGTRMVIWGGYGGLVGTSHVFFNTGGCYDPSADTWTSTSTGPNDPVSRYAHCAVWTGTEMIVWGGYNINFSPYQFNTGGRYNPSTDTWTATSVGAGLPGPRYGHTAVWTGTQMIVWGADTLTPTGGIYCACPNGVIGYRDADGDGYGTSGDSVEACDGIIPAGYVTNGADCNDTNRSVHPGVPETCNGIDDDCNGNIDDNGSLLCSDGNVCTDDVCNGISGCSHAYNAAPCDDGDACTANDTCAAGTCHSGPPRNCDDSNLCTDDSCDPATGCVHVDNTPSCDDGNACTTDLCLRYLGCVHVNNTDPCDDGNACTTIDSCLNGSCQSGPRRLCDDGDVCTDDSCDPSVGCVHVYNDAPCSDGNPCTTSDTCGGGACNGGPALNCDDGNPCTTDSCNPSSGCVHVNNTNPCSDGNACTTGDVCGGGSCHGGAAPNCDDGNICTTDSCSPTSGCVHANNTNACDDGNACTTNDSCGGGACNGGPAPNCDDANPCTDDSCNPASGCVHANNTSPCNDGNACTTGDVCSGGTCHGGPAPNCDDGNVCTTDTCSPTSGCVHANNTNPCDDGNVCTDNDTCGGGSCNPGAPHACDDGNVCTTDSCNPTSGCVFTNNSNSCDDDNACTTNDTCGGGACHGGPAPNCDDGNVCTSDSCNPASGCVHTNNTNPCDDGNACTTGDVCGGGSCRPGAPTSCDDGNCCTTDTCDPATGCHHAPNLTPPVFTTQPSLGACPVLWPPNHGYVDFTVQDTGAQAQAQCGIASISFASCASSQPENAYGTGDGNSTRDCVYEPGAVHLRAERNGACSPIGRDYLMTLIATDTCGNAVTSNPIDVAVWNDRTHQPAGTIYGARGGTNDQRDGVNGTYNSDVDGCGSGSACANGTVADHSDVDPEMEISQSAGIDVGDLKLNKVNGNLQLTWSMPSPRAPVNVTRFHVYRRDPETLAWTMVMELNKSQTGWNDPSMNDGHNWQYKVTAIIK